MSRADILVPGGPASGEALVMDMPISFWGGIDPRTGIVVDVRHPQRGVAVGGRILFLPGTIGSSSASSVLLELVRQGKAPAALVMPRPDAILLVGLIVAREMGWSAPPALRLDLVEHARFGQTRVAVGSDGMLSIQV